MKNHQEDLEKKLQEATPKKDTCGYCGKKLEEKHYQSPQGDYCNRNCFDLFTED